MTLENFEDLVEQAETTYPRRRPRRRKILIPITGPVVLMSVGLFIATILSGGLVGAWITGDVTGTIALHHLVVIACTIAAMAYFTGREWLSERHRKQAEAERLATVMIWHTDRSDESKELLRAVAELRRACRTVGSSVDEMRKHQEAALAGLAAEVEDLRREFAERFVDRLHVVPVNGSNGVVKIHPRS